MFKDYVIVDNALKNPQKLIELSKTLKYYSSDEYDANKPKGNWSGYRSDSLDVVDHEFFCETFNEISQTLFNNILISEFNFMVEAYLHYLPKKFQVNENFMHTDNGSIFAGVIYLNENSPKNSGTILNINDNNFIVENKYNRLIAYNSKIKHMSQNSFGETKDDARLTLTFFYKKIEIIA
jgi:hypothetical protein